MRVAQILQTKGAAVHTVSVTAPIADVVEVLNANNIGAVIVTERDGSIAGVLSERDVVRRLGQSRSSVMELKAKACMTPDPITCTPEDTSDVLMSLMTRHRIRHVPIVENGKLAGVVSIGDVVRVRMEEVEQEAAALREYIAS